MCYRKRNSTFQLVLGLYKYILSLLYYEMKTAIFNCNSLKPKFGQMQTSEKVALKNNDNHLKCTLAFG